MSMAIAIENPNAAFFEVAYQMIIDKGGLVIPQFITAQVSPMQIDNKLKFVPGFLPHEDFPSKDSLFEIQAVITKLLGGGNIFDTMIIALINYYRAGGVTLLRE